MMCTVQAEKAGDKLQGGAEDAKGKSKDLAGDAKGAAKDAAGLLPFSSLSFPLFPFQAVPHCCRTQATFPFAEGCSAIFAMLSIKQF